MEAKNNGDGQAPGGTARGILATNWWGGDALWEERNTLEGSGGGEED